VLWDLPSVVSTGFSFDIWGRVIMPTGQHQISVNIVDENTKIDFHAVSYHNLTVGNLSRFSLDYYDGERWGSLGVVPPIVPSPVANGTFHMNLYRDEDMWRFRVNGIPLNMNVFQDSNATLLKIDANPRFPGVTLRIDAIVVDATHVLWGNIFLTLKSGCIL
jgi:hypothetical protein